VVRVNDITQIPARDDAGHRQVFHHYLPDRRSHTRGVTAFAPMADTADHWDDLGILAVNLDLPLCVFLLDASETNYSGFRGAIDQARQRWREIQSWMMGSFHRPVYEWKVRQWAVTDSALRKAVQRADDELAASLAATWCRQERPGKCIEFIPNTSVARPGHIHLGHLRSITSLGSSTAPPA